MADLKTFELHLEGTYSTFPHPDRAIAVSLDDSYGDNSKITDEDILVIIHEISCAHKRKIQQSMPPQIWAGTINQILSAIKDFHFGTGQSFLHKCDITIRGNYCEEKNPSREMIFAIFGLSKIEVLVVLHAGVEQARNKLAETMNRPRLQAIAEKYNIIGFGMQKNEAPFRKY